MADVAEIAENLKPHHRACLMDSDPHHVSGSVATMMDLCLRGLADVRDDCGIELSSLGLSVRDYVASQLENM